MLEHSLRRLPLKQSALNEITLLSLPCGGVVVRVGGQLASVYHLGAPVSFMSLPYHASGCGLHLSG